MIVYVLSECIQYEGGQVLSVHASLAAAQQAAQKVNVETLDWMDPHSFSIIYTYSDEVLMANCQRNSDSCYYMIEQFEVETEAIP